MQVEPLDSQTTPPQFDMRKFTAPRITCSAEDSVWVLKLPPILNDVEGDDADEIEISLVDTSAVNLLTFRAAQRTVFLSKNIRTMILSGLRCPEPNVTMTFKLHNRTNGGTSI